LELGETATMKEIKSSYRRLAQRYHPDKHGDADSERDEIMKRVNQAYNLLMDYCADYRYAFKREDVARTRPEEEDYKKWQEKWSGFF
jgi:DnaJ-class molecular chaperone